MTTSGFGRLLLALLSVILLAGPAAAQIKVPSQGPAETPDAGRAAPVMVDYPIGSALSLAKDIGFQRARMAKNDKKEDYVSGQVNGISTAIYREKCENQTCNVLSLYAYFGTKLRADFKFMNAYNQAYFAKLIQVGTNSWTLEMNILLYDGVTEEHIRQLARIFVSSIKLAQDFKPS